MICICVSPKLVSELDEPEEVATGEAVVVVDEGEPKTSSRMDAMECKGGRVVVAFE